MRVLFYLNDWWRVAEDGRLQWFLQERRATAARAGDRRATGRYRWDTRSYNAFRPVLERNIKAWAGVVPAAALADLAALPERYGRM